jgi:hypothetical protein
MSKSDLQKKLRDLHQEIEKTEPDDEQRQVILDDLKGHVQKVLDEPDGDYHHSLSERLKNNLLVFEVEHPSLTAAMEMVSEHLSSLGI